MVTNRLRCGALAKASVLLAAAGASFLVANAAVAQDALRIGVSTQSQILSSYDMKTHKAGGYGVDLLEAIGKTKGWSLTYVPTTVPGSPALVDLLDQGKIDIIAYPFQMTADRQAKYTFSKPIVSYGETIVVAKSDRADYPNAKALKGKKVAVVAGSQYVDILKKAGAIPLAVKDINAAIAKVGTNSAAVMGAGPYFEALIKADANSKGRIPQEYQPSSVLPAGYGIKKGNDALLQKLNAAIDDADKDGTMLRLLNQYGLKK